MDPNPYFGYIACKQVVERVEIQVMTTLKPFLRWAGSKRKLVPRLRDFWQPSYARYVEPFAGSSCLFFDLCPKRALLADNNHNLIETYHVVRDHPMEVYDRVAALPRTSATYYAVRGSKPARGRIDRAVRFIYLNRNCFNGIYRTNEDGQFNVPFATSRAGAFLSRDEFLASAQLLWHAQLRACDFGTTLRNVGKGDFVYLDPPFAVSNRRVFREYGARPFQTIDLERLGDHLHAISKRGAHFLVSYADCSEARHLATSWTSRRVRVRRHVAGFTGARRLAFELLITNIPH